MPESLAETTFDGSSGAVIVWSHDDMVPIYLTVSKSF